MGGGGKLGIRHRVVFAGSRRISPDLLEVMDVFVFPSLSEGLPMALLEGPGVGDADGGHPGWGHTIGGFLDHVSGLLIPPADRDAIAGAVVRILSDSVAASMMAAAASERVRENFPPGRWQTDILPCNHEI